MARDVGDVAEPGTLPLVDEVDEVAADGPARNRDAAHLVARVRRSIGGTSDWWISRARRHLRAQLTVDTPSRLMSTMNST